MKTINNLEDIRLAEQPLISPAIRIDPGAGHVRIPLLFLIDVSGSMASALPVINETLTKLMEDIYNAGSAERFMVDFAIITFGGNRKNDNGNGVVIEREFDLLKPGEVFQIKKCSGKTPLGEAMLQAFYYASKRKQMYQAAELAEYNQPTLVLITDFCENSSRDAFINNQMISGKNLFAEMAELYTQCHLVSI